MTNKELNTMLQTNIGAYLFCKQHGLNDKLANLEFFNDTKAKSHNDFYRYIIQFLYN